MVTDGTVGNHYPVEMHRRERDARDVPFVEYRAAFGRSIGICG